MLSRFNKIPESNGQTDGRTELLIFAISISRVSVPTRDKNPTLAEIASHVLTIPGFLHFCLQVAFSLYCMTLKLLSQLP